MTFGQGFDPPHFHQKGVLLFFKISSLLIVLLFLSSCALNEQRTISFDATHQNIYISQHTSATGFHSQSSKSYQKKSKNIYISNDRYIKGIVVKKYFSKKYHKWAYLIKATDTSNHKLPSTTVFSRKNLAKIGYMIYAMIKNKNIISLYVLNPTNENLKKNLKYTFKRKIKKNQKYTIKTPNKTISKRRKEVILAPVPEKIIF